MQAYATHLAADAVRVAAEPVEGGSYAAVGLPEIVDAAAHIENGAKHHPSSACPVPEDEAEHADD
jgi:hypothetical protein